MIRAGLEDLEAVNRLLRRDWPDADYEEVLANPLNVCLLAGESGATFAWRGPGIYEFHVFFGVRGRAAVDLAQLMLSYVAAEYGGRFFWTLVPLELHHVRLFARWIGLKSQGPLETQLGPCELFASENSLCPLSQ